VLLEFAPDAVVLMAGAAGAEGTVLRHTVAELLPEAFRTFRFPDGGGDA
jgi:hypothetical protein